MLDRTRSGSMALYVIHLACPGLVFDIFNVPKLDPNSALCTAHPRLAAWCRERCGSPVRVVFGPGLSYIAWQPMGSHMCREEAPKSAKELINSAHTLYTSIRLVALGVQDAYIIIWENGVMRWDLKDQYAALDIILWKCDGEDVSVRTQSLNAAPILANAEDQGLTHIFSSSQSIRTAPAIILSILTRPN